jgi:hypothetical protein
MSQFSMKRRVESLRSSRQFPLLIFCETVWTNVGLSESGQRSYFHFALLYWNCIFSVLNSQTVIYFDKQHVSWNIVSSSEQLLILCSSLVSKIICFWRMYFPRMTFSESRKNNGMPLKVAGGNNKKNLPSTRVTLMHDS